MGLLFLVTLLSLLTRRWTIPYPTIMVLTGLAIALTPGLPTVQLTPEVVFLIFLPPLLYAAAWNTNWKEFKGNLRPISLLALGLVLVTTVVVALVVKHWVPEMPWAAAFALGAIISPPDAIAATSLTKSLPIPRRIVVILEGESLLNDATGLVAYRVAVLAGTTGVFSLYDSCIAFLWAVVGGVMMGIIAAWIVIRMHRLIEDPVIETTLSLLTPYAIYLPCESLHMSGVLAVVTTGLIATRHAERFMSSETRLHATAVWENVLFVLNGLTFIFIGLGLRDVVAAMDNQPLAWNIITALIVLLITITIRIAWVFPAAYIPRFLFKSIRDRDPYPNPAHVLVIGWTGMRGVVSLAAALALPIEFPFRNLILFIVFVVILGTLVLQSLSLPWMIRKLGIGAHGRSHVEQEIDARLWTLAAANSYLESNAAKSNEGNRDLQYLRTHFEIQANQVVAKLRLELDNIDPEVVAAEPLCRSLYTGAIEAQRIRLRALLDGSIIDDEMFNKLRREIDLDETRLKSASTLP